MKEKKIHIHYIDYDYDVYFIRLFDDVCFGSIITYHIVGNFVFFKDIVKSTKIK